MHIFAVALGALRGRALLEAFENCEAATVADHPVEERPVRGKHIDFSTIRRGDGETSMIRVQYDSQVPARTEEAVHGPSDFPVFVGGLISDGDHEVVEEAVVAVRIAPQKPSECAERLIDRREERVQPCWVEHHSHQDFNAAQESAAAPDAAKDNGAETAHRRGTGQVPVRVRNGAGDD